MLGLNMDNVLLPGLISLQVILIFFFQKVNIANDSSRESSASATSYRGHKLAFHIGEILKHAGATVELEECDQRKPSAKIRQNLPPILLNPEMDGETTFKCTGLCPPPAPRVEPSANVGRGEFQRLVAAGMSKPMGEKKKENKGIFKELLDVFDPSVPLQPPKDQKKEFIEEIFDAHKDIKAIIKSSKESKTETTSYTIENVTEESYPPPCNDKIFKKHHCFYVPKLGEKKMEAPLVTRKVKANLPTTKEEEKNEINLYIAREPLPTTMISKANQYLYAPVVHMKTSKVWNGSTEDLCK